MKHIVPCSWTAVFVSEKEYVKMSSYLLRQCLVCSQVLDKVLVLILSVK